MIDLHLHTTASDGRSSPRDLVAEAAAAGLTTIAVTDHDTTAALSEVEDAARQAGLDTVSGIEITAIHDGKDVHVLGYFIDAAHPPFVAFLKAQRDDRRRRVGEIARRLEELGVPVDVTNAMAEAAKQRGRSVGRPLVAAALVSAGHARDMSDAFDRFLGAGKPAFVPRVGADAAGVIRAIREAGGLSSLAHPGKLGLDPLIPALATAGLSAIEAYHPDHEPADRSRYEAMAREHGLLVTGGSDYHGPGSGRSAALGGVGLPAEAFARLVARGRRP